MVTSEECVGAFAAPDVFKSTKEITRNVNLRRESEQQATPKAVECRLQVMASVKPPLVKVKQESGEKLYALVGSEQVSSPESPVPFPKPEPAPSLPRKTAEGDLDMPAKPENVEENNSNEQSDVRPPPEQKPKKLTPTEREEQFRERMLGILEKKFEVVGGIAEMLQSTQESFQKTVDALQGMEGEKMEDQAKKIADLEKTLKEEKDRADGLAEKATDLNKLRDVWGDITPEKLKALREGTGGGRIKSGISWVCTLAPLAMLIIVLAFLGWKNIQQMQQVAKPAAEAPAPQASGEEKSKEDEELDEYIRKLESEAK